MWTRLEVCSFGPLTGLPLSFYGLVHMELPFSVTSRRPYRFWIVCCQPGFDGVYCIDLVLVELLIALDSPNPAVYLNSEANGHNHDHNSQLPTTSTHKPPDLARNYTFILSFLQISLSFTRAFVSKCKFASLTCFTFHHIHPTVSFGHAPSPQTPSSDTFQRSLRSLQPSLVPQLFLKLLEPFGSF